MADLRRWRYLGAATLWPWPAVAQAEELAPLGLLEQLVDWLQAAPPAVVVATLLIAPVFGVPLSGLLVVLTLVFPLGIALPITLFALLAHHALVYLLSHTRASIWLRNQLTQRRFLPPRLADKSLADDAIFLFAITWVPGLSYIFKLALAALSGIPARIYFTLGVLSQLLASLPYLLLGKVAGQGDFLLLTVLIFLVTLLAWLLKHFIGRRRRAALRASLTGRE